MYFLIHNSDGDTTVTAIEPAQFLKDLADGDYGTVEFLTKLPVMTDTNYWGEHTYLIISGEIVAPKPKEVVTQYEF
jgi:hypothetical protein